MNYLINVYNLAFLDEPGFWEMTDPTNCRPDLWVTTQTDQDGIMYCEIKYI